METEEDDQKQKEKIEARLKETFTDDSTCSITENRKTTKLETEMEREQLYGYFKRGNGEISHETTWKLLKKGKPQHRN